MTQKKNPDRLYRPPRHRLRSPKTVRHLSGTEYEVDWREGLTLSEADAFSGVQTGMALIQGDTTSSG